MPVNIRINFYSPPPCSGSTRREHIHRKTIIICNSWAWLPNMASNRFYVPTFTSVLQQHSQVLIHPSLDYALFADLPNTNYYNMLLGVVDVKNILYTPLHLTFNHTTQLTKPSKPCTTRAWVTAQENRTHGLPTANSML